jgi:hypothetical protein
MMEALPARPCRKTAAPACAAHRRPERRPRRLDARASGVRVGTRLTVEPFAAAYASRAIKERVPMSQLPTQHIEAAKNRTDKVQQDLEVASAELGLAHGALDRHLPPDARSGDVAWAIAQNKILERKVQRAAEELEEVTELLEQAQAG